ncbi:MAG: hypothetical protein ACYTG7_25735 [Planctomycetota bacterium]|jgi:hypothetical protein
MSDEIDTGPSMDARSVLEVFKININRALDLDEIEIIGGNNFDAKAGVDELVERDVLQYSQGERRWRIK